MPPWGLQLAVKVVDHALARYLVIGQHVRKDLEEVRFTGAKEAADPHAHFIGGDVERAVVHLKEIGKVALELARYHVLFQLLAHGLAFIVLHLDHAVDGTVDVFGKRSRISM